VCVCSACGREPLFTYTLFTYVGCVKVGIACVGNACVCGVGEQRVRTRAPRFALTNIHIQRRTPCAPWSAVTATAGAVTLPRDAVTVPRDAQEGALGRSDGIPRDRVVARVTESWPA
jgi:hypothetical protein